MAIMVVLSVFNGFSELAYSHLASVDPDVRISPANGKVIESADSLADIIQSRDYVGAASVVLQERALFVAGDHQMPIIFKGLDPAKANIIADIDSVIIDGVYTDSNGITQIANSFSESASNSSKAKLFSKIPNANFSSDLNDFIGRDKSCRIVPSVEARKFSSMTFSRCSDLKRIKCESKNPCGEFSFFLCKLEIDARTPFALFVLKTPSFFPLKSGHGTLSKEKISP